MAGRQLPLDLGHRTAFEAADFLEAPSNAQALAWLARWPDWPGHASCLWGPPGCGKTHLAHLFAARCGGAVLPATAIESRPGGHLVVEDADRGVDEVALFHLFNATREAGAFLLLTGRAPPSRWAIRLPDLASRLNAIPAIAIQAPDDALMAAVLVKLFADRQLEVGAGVIDWLVTRGERSFAAAGAVVARLDAQALAERRNITLPFVRAVIPDREAG
ncbi:MAG: DNA replication protein [Alphaproteobacteria bacterium]|nr:DNA replication protein [Alphaproteobacteria bacterium]MBF0392841.1 DNA replication protein [Alphaproteobacteria bacterium]